MSEDTSGRNIGHFIGWVIVAVTVLWMASSGLCAAVLIFDMVDDGGISQDAAGWAVLILIVSGISIALAYALFVVGRGLSRGK